MGSALSLRQSEFSVIWLPTKPSVDATMPPLDDVENVSVTGQEAAPGMRDQRAISRLLAAFCVGVVATLTWQSCSDAARQLVASPSLQLGGLAPIAQTSLDMIAPAAFALPSRDQQDLAALRQSIDQLATSQQQINLSLVQLASAQEQMTRDINTLKQPERPIISNVSRHIVSNMSVPLPRPAPAETRKHGSRLATIAPGAGPNVHHAVTSSTSIGTSSSSPVLATRLDAGHKRTRVPAADPRSATPDSFSQSLISARQSLMSALSKITGIQL